MSKASFEYQNQNKQLSRAQQQQQTLTSSPLVRVLEGKRESVVDGRQLNGYVVLLLLLVVVVVVGRCAHARRCVRACHGFGCCRFALIHGIVVVVDFVCCCCFSDT